jgi:hypothetical protein
MIALHTLPYNHITLWNIKTTKKELFEGYFNWLNEIANALGLDITTDFPVLVLEYEYDERTHPVSKEDYQRNTLAFKKLLGLFTINYYLETILRVERVRCEVVEIVAE